MTTDSTRAPPEDGGAAARPLRTLVVEGNPLLREILAWLLTEDPRFEVVGSVASGDEAAAWTAPVDAALVDLAVPGLDALQTVYALRNRHPDATVVVVATVDVPYLRAAAAKAGADGFVDWPTPVPALRELLLGLHGGTMDRTGQPA